MLFFTDNCTCTGVSNLYGEGSECEFVSDSSDPYLNGVWCFAETATCREAKFHANFDTARYGPSRTACLNINGTLYEYL